MIAAILVFLLFVGGATLPLAARLRGFAPLTRLALGAGGALVGLYLATGALWLGGLDWRWLWLWPAASAALAWRERAAIRALAAEPVVTTTLAGWLVIAAWCLGLQLMVVSYSGGTWTVDWYEHYERALFFQQYGPATLATATSTVGHAPAVDTGRKIAIAAANVGYSLIPDFVSPAGVMLLAQLRVQVSRPAALRRGSGRGRAPGHRRRARCTAGFRAVAGSVIRPEQP
ncbi:MAG: hypothetical protein QG602_4131 [Verrucomicrobiota bacterium]|nr:hypothetical protein [Verrucomicrobiota bacterium]